MPAPLDQQTLRQRLSRELRRYRTAASLTQRDVAHAMDWSLSKVIRIESGTVAVSTNDLRALLAHFGVLDSATVTALIDVAKDSKRPAWSPPGANRGRTEADETDRQFGVRLASATAVRQYAPLMIPALLQTEEYRRAVAVDVRMLEGPTLERAVTQGRQRQQILDRAHPAEMCFVLDEAAIHRPVGGPGTMPRQLKHLVQLGSRRHISVQIVPFARGPYTGLLGPFVLLDFADADRALFVEGRAGVESRSDPDEVSIHLDHFQQLQHKLGSDPDHLSEMIAKLHPPT